MLDLSFGSKCMVFIEINQIKQETTMNKALGKFEKMIKTGLGSTSTSIDGIGNYLGIDFSINSPQVKSE